MPTKKSNQVKRRSAAGEAVPLADRVAKARAALEQRGGVKIPGGWLQPEPAKALNWLHTHGYASTRVGCLSRALVEAEQRARTRSAKSRKKP